MPSFVINSIPGVIKLPSIASGFALSNGVKLPCIGLGTWQIPEEKTLLAALSSAIKLGYRHFDTAHIYGNERTIAKAIELSGLPRSEFFITTKLWNADRGYRSAIEAFNASLNAFRLEYIDLFLMQWPAAKGEPMTWQSINSGTWRAFEELYEGGLVRSIGVSNFLVHHLVPLLAKAKIAPMVNQLEIHPGYTQMSTVQFCQEHGIQAVAWSPLGRGALLRHPAVSEIADRLGVKPSQVILRWCLQHGIAAVPKSLNVEHQRQNADLFSFELSDADMERLDTLPTACFSGLDPDHVTF